MRREPDITGPSWLSLHEAAERLSRYLGDFTRFALNDVLARGLVPVLAMRRDAVAMLPDRVEGLLAKASGINVVSHNNTILAHYRFASEQDFHQVLGPRSHFTFADPGPRGRPLIVNLDFDQVRICWAILIGELRRVGGVSADETTLRKLGLWPDSWDPVSSSPSDEAPQGVEPRGDTRGLAPVRPPAPSPNPQRGPRPDKRLRVEAAMRDNIGDDSYKAQALRLAKEEQLATFHNVSRDTIRRARRTVLSEFQLRQIPTIDK
jgi:hypothetical protein